MPGWTPRFVTDFSMLTPQETSGLVAKVADAAALHGGRSLWSDARRRFLRNRAAVISLVVLTVICLACVVGPWVLPHAFDSADWDAMSTAPSFVNAHYWGTDDAGRDLLVRCLVGGRVSLTVGLLAAISSVSLGIVWGATAGFVGGKVDAVMMRIVDMMYAIPYLLIAILLVTILGREFYLVVLTITVFSWMDMARCAGTNPVIALQGICRSGPCDWCIYAAHHRAAYRAQSAGRGRDLHHRNGAGRHTD